LVRIDTGGSIDSSFNIDSGFNGSVTKINLQADGKMFVIGNFGRYQ
jgi:hypothetical protein